MANKPLSMLLIRRLLQLKGQGSSNRQIAMILRVSRNTLNTYMARIDQCSSSYTDLLKLSDEALATVALTDITSPEKSDGKQDGFEQRLKYFTEQLKNK